MLLDGDTIAAISTANGRGAIAVLRVSGPAAFTIVRQVVLRWPESPRSAVLTTLRNPIDNHAVDQVLVTRFDAPRSYTGEAMVEISTHGGIAVPPAALRALLLAGARQARPGEFTQRALLAGKLDLPQAEGIVELIDARTEAHRRIALQHADGSLSQSLSDLRQQMLNVEALLAYDVDFPTEDDGPLPRSAVQQAAAGVLALLEKLLSTVDAGQIAQHGATIVIAGVPNAGKSSLFNALAGEQRAIVTEHPGTTRDAIEVVLDDELVPLRVIDTAGLRDTNDATERLGIEVSFRHLATATVVLVCGEEDEDISETVRRVQEAGTIGALVRVRTKVDRPSRNQPRVGEIAVSAVERTGLRELLEEIRRVIRTRIGDIEPLTPVITRTRHRVALEQALVEMRAFQNAWHNDVLPSVVAAIHVRSAIHAMNELIGQIDTEAILGAVFARFCIGK